MADFSERFAPKVHVKLDPPQDREFTLEELANYDGMLVSVGVRGFNLLC